MSRSGDHRERWPRVRRERGAVIKVGDGYMWTIEDGKFGEGVGRGVAGQFAGGEAVVVYAAVGPEGEGERRGGEEGLFLGPSA